jgi:hypothetical protein
MCLIHINDSATHVSTAARPSRLCVSFYEKLDILLDRLDNRRMMHDSQNEALEWARMDRSDTHY